MLYKILELISSPDKIEILSNNAVKDSNKFDIKEVYSQWMKTLSALA